MKKPTLILILFLFTACAIGGYLAASKINIGSGSSSSGAQSLSTALASSQQNFLLVRVDDLSSATPQLVEAWVVFTAYSDPPQVMFMPLYPAYDASKNKTLADAFAVGSDGKLTSRLQQTIAKEYDFSLNGNIVIDSTGMNGLAGWFGISGIQVNSVPATTDLEVHNILVNSQFFFENVCAQLKSGQAKTQFDSIKWSKLIPAHFQTDLSFEQLMASWDRIVRGAAPQQCDVLSNE
ncbi:hypothetical protein SDC9_115634 [bioreactor metagenome]|uniref:Uncharacterized protein n=1 Tax=bioreactor metagenome TaxID=1076179 RepID=A0A645BTF0_9ZZZZ